MNIMIQMRRDWDRMLSGILLLHSAF